MARSHHKAPEETDNINSIVLRLVFHGKIPADDVPLDLLQTLLSDGLAIEKGEELVPTEKCRKYADTLRKLASL